MFIEKLLNFIEQESHTFVWWKPEQIARGEDVKNDPTKGERPWIIPKTTGEFLYEKIVEHGAKNVLELGTSIGYSTLWIAHAINANHHEQTNGQVHTIERSENKIIQAKKYFAESEYEKNITLYHGMIADVLETMPDDLQFDCVFMDADRGHYHEYFHLIEKHLVPGALILADNAGNMNDRMKPFLELLANKNISYEIVDLDNGILVATYK